MLNKTSEGLVVNLQDYSVHDGCGLRSVLFLKGCALKCKWCQNPECIDKDIEILFALPLCTGCGKCSDVCPASAIQSGDFRINREKCDKCGACIKVCPNGALKVAGFWTDAEKITNQIEKYKVFYKNSDNGGVTISGGDPIFQSEFSLKVLEACEKRGIHTAVETSAFGPEDVFMEIIRHTRLLLIDIKHMDSVKHKEGTGVCNELILKNLRNWSQMVNRPECVIRIPLIPDFNDDEKNISETCSFVKEIGLKQIDLLPFNILPTSKYRELGKEWEYTGVSSQTSDKLEKLSSIVNSFGLKTTVGGLW